ncbi:MAG: aldo/keto reductase [Bacteroidetes bacterium]|nr:aldo/keto reductase [Bacteroidota bacterium]
MRTRRLGNDGPELTVVGFGAWAIGGPWEFGWGPVDDSASVKAIRRAIDLGINWIDTAAVYGLGHSEEMVAQAVKGIRDNVFIATKCGMVWDENKKIRVHLGPESIRSEIENSLRRLNTDHVDLYQFHWPDPHTPVEESWAVMLKLKEEGKVRYVGVSNFDVSLLKRCMALGPVQSLQPPYNLLKREVESEILPYCLKNGIGVVAYSPMMSGLLSGKFDINRVAGDDWRRRDKMFQEPQLTKEMAFIEKLRPLASKYGKTVGQLSVAWVNINPAVTSSIVGARNVSQVEDNVAADFEIAKDDLQRIEKLSKETIG